MSDSITTLKIIGYGIVVVTIICAIYLVIHYPIPEAHGQNTTLPKVVTSPPNPTPTTPSPNFQYLPQKAFVIPFAPENGVPASVPPLGTPLATGPIQTVQPVQQPVAAAAPGGFDMATIMSVIGAIVGGGALLKSKLVGDKANKTETIVKETVLPATAQTKEQVGEVAKFAFKANPAAAEALNDAPCIKLENLEKDKQDFTEKSAKA